MYLPTRLPFLICNCILLYETYSTNDQIINKIKNVYYLLKIISSGQCKLFF